MLFDHIVIVEGDKFGTAHWPKRKFPCASTNQHQQESGDTIFITASPCQPTQPTLTQSSNSDRETKYDGTYFTSETKQNNRKKNHLEILFWYCRTRNRIK